MSKKAWFSESPEGFTGVPKFVFRLFTEKKITAQAFTVAFYLCGVADTFSAEVIAQGMGHIAQQLNTYPSNVSDAIQQLENVKFLLRDSGANGRILNRYKLFNSPEEYDADYIFTRESKATNKSALGTKGKKAGTTATPKPTRLPKEDPYSGQYMPVSLNYLNWYFSDSSSFDALGIFEEKLDTSTTLPNFVYVELDKSTFDDFKSHASKKGLPFPEIFQPNKPYLFDSVDWDFLEQKYGNLPFEMFPDTP